QARAWSQPANQDPGLKRVILLAFICCSCGKYATFTLPPPDAAGPKGPFHWEALPDPVLTRGDASDVLNPSVVRYRGEYLYYYSSYDGRTWSTDLAASSDGIH